MRCVFGDVATRSLLLLLAASSSLSSSNSNVDVVESCSVASIATNTSEWRPRSEKNSIKTAWIEFYHHPARSTRAHFTQTQQNVSWKVIKYKTSTSSNKIKVSFTIDFIIFFHSRGSWLLWTAPTVVMLAASRLLHREPWGDADVLASFYMTHVI